MITTTQSPLAMSRFVSFTGVLYDPGHYAAGAIENDEVKADGQIDFSYRLLSSALDDQHQALESTLATV